MLSSPPRSLASWINFSGTASKSFCSRASRISSFVMRFESPSEQSRNLSPGRVSTPITSTSTSSSKPTERVMMFHSRLKNIITRSVGFEEDVLVDVMGVETRPGDKFLLCSDGLSNLMTNEEIRDALLQNDFDAVPEKLIQLANERGGDDNITVVVVQRVE